MKNAFWMVVIVIAAVVGALMGPSLFEMMDPGLALLVCGLLMLFLIGFVVFSLSGNRGGKRADASADGDARTLRASPGKARIYFVRRGFVGSAQGMNVSIEGVANGQIKSGQFLMAEVDPGNYRVDARMARGGKSSESSMDLALAEGEVAVIHALLEMGMLSGTTKLTRLDETRARDEISATRMMLWN